MLTRIVFTVPIPGYSNTPSTVGNVEQLNVIDKIITLLKFFKILMSHTIGNSKIIRCNNTCFV